MPQLPQPVCPGGACSAAGEATAARSRSAAAREEPHLPQLEKSPGSNKDPTQPKISKQKLLKKKLNIQKTKIIASGPITSWHIDGETVTDFIFGGLQNHCRW